MAANLLVARREEGLARLGVVHLPKEVVDGEQPPRKLLGRRDRVPAVRPPIRAMHARDEPVNALNLRLLLGRGERAPSHRVYKIHALEELSKVLLHTFTLALPLLEHCIRRRRAKEFEE